MPGGDGTLSPLIWQPVSGATLSSIYPFIRKTDTISSNSYLIASPDVIILIDPGGLPEQAEQLSAIIGECREEKDRPVLIILTHAHLDHFAGAVAIPAFAYPETAVFAVQERGAESLEQGDAKLTQADLLGMTIPKIKVGLHLFPGFPEADDGVPVPQAFPNGVIFTVTYNRSGAGGIPPSARLEFKNGPVLEVYHTPGHSPDSICIRIGGLLFIGDILFAANPGIAGLCGWDQKALLRSLDGIQAVLAGGGISTVCPGHGRVLAGGEAARMLDNIRTDARALAGIAELNRERAGETAAYAEDCMEQTNELFTVMAGRLYYVSYVMEELGESELAGRMDMLIPGDTVDELLEAFAAFAEEHHRADRVPIHLALKAGQVMGKLERSLKRDELQRVIDPALVGRAERLLSDYTTMLRGFTPPAERLEWPLVPLVGAIVTGLSVSSCSDEDLLSSADDGEAFLQVLLSRIGARPLLEDIALTLDTGDPDLTAVVDRDHFSDLVTYILEDLVGTGSDRVEMSIQQKDRLACIMINGNVMQKAILHERRNLNFLKGLAKRAGGTLMCQEDAGMRRFLIHLGHGTSGA